MSYVTSTETTGHQIPATTGEPVAIRKLTASQGARSELYDVYQPTGAVRRQRTGAPPRVPSKASPTDPRVTIAINEHVRRQLRAGLEKAAALVDAQDPRDVALLASNLRTLLQELWQYRSAHSSDWAEMLNLLQLILGKEDFEQLSLSKRQGLLRVFQEGWFSRAVDRSDMDRFVSLLSGSGFDIWLGIRVEDSA